jgi:hypothetical protein
VRLINDGSGKGDRSVIYVKQMLDAFDADHNELQAQQENECRAEPGKQTLASCEASLGEQGHSSLVPAISQY